MASQNDTSLQAQRIDWPYYDGINSNVSANLRKIYEPVEVENARSVVIGTLQKRAGSSLIGNDIDASYDYGFFHFEDEAETRRIWRVSMDGGVVSIHYLSVNNTWVPLSGDGTDLFKLGQASSRFAISNPSTNIWRYSYDGTGVDPEINSHIYVGDTIIISAQNFSSNNNGTFTISGIGEDYFEVTKTSGTAETEVTIGTGSITVAGRMISVAKAGKCLFLVDGFNNNRYIDKSGTVTTSATSSGNLYNCPRASFINYYKNRLYVADYYNGQNRNPDGVMKSSEPVGIVALVDGDHASGVVTIKVTDSKYIHNSDTLDVYRGNQNLITTLTVTGKTESTISVSATSVPLLSSDELWVGGTYNGPKVFRWAEAPSTGTNVKVYDTFKLSSSDDDSPITMLTNVGKNMIIGTSNNFHVWNEYQLEPLDLGIGCASKRGSVKHLGVLYFIHYTGIYSTTGGVPTLISSKVQQYIDGATKNGIENAAAGYKGMSIFFAIGDVNLYNDDGSIRKTLEDVVLEYNIQQKNWFVHTKLPISQFLAFIGTTNINSCYISNREDNNVYEFLTGERDWALPDTPHSGDIIPMSVRFGPIALSKFPEYFGQPTEIISEIERGSGSSLWVAIDDGELYQLSNNLRKGTNIIKVKTKFDGIETVKGKSVEIEIRDNTRKTCRLGPMGLIFIKTNERDYSNSKD